MKQITPPTPKEILRAIVRNENATIAKWCQARVLHIAQEIRGESLKTHCILAGNLIALSILLSYGLQLELEDLSIVRDEGLNAALAYILALQEDAQDSQ